MGSQKKMILRREAWDKLPSLGARATQLFSAREVFWYDPPEELPPASPKGIHYEGEGPAYISYVRSQLAKGVKDTGKLRSFIEGLKCCGEAGSKLTDEIKQTLR